MDNPAGARVQRGDGSMMEFRTRRLPASAVEVTTSPRGLPTPPRPLCPPSGASLPFPEIGDTVRFQRTRTHHPEEGIVRGRSFGTRAIDVVDMQAKPLRLMAGEYELVSP